MLRVKNISEVIGKKAYTSDGDFFGQVEEVNLYDNKVEGWKIRVSSTFMNSLGGARGVIIPHQFVKSIGDVFIISKGNLPGKDEAGDSLGGQDMNANSESSEELI